MLYFVSINNTTHFSNTVCLYWIPFALVFNDCNILHCYSLRKQLITIGNTSPRFDPHETHPRLGMCNVHTTCSQQCNNNRFSIRFHFGFCASQSVQSTEYFT